jgi:hypothetical protein
MRTPTILAVMVVVGLGCFLAARVAVAENELTVTDPQEGAQVGPATEVLGTAPVGSLVIIVTEVYDQSTGDLLRKIPGIRHRPNQDGSFHFRVATPRLSFGTDTPLVYKMNVKAVTEQQTYGPVVITLTPAPPAEK